MRVVLANYTLSMMRGGGETRDLTLARELERLGIEVELLTIRPLGGRIRHEVRGLACRYLTSPYFRDLVYRLMQLPKCGRLAAFLLRQDLHQFSRRVVDLLANPAERVDLLQAAGLYPVVELKRRRAIPVVIRNQGGLPPAHLHRYVPLADAVIGDGWDAANFQQRLGRELVEIPGGVNLELFRPVRSDLRQQLGLTDAEVVLYVGRFAPLKNVALLIEAFALLRRERPRARLLLVGEGALESPLRADVKRLGLTAEVVFAGAQELEALPAYYAAADVFALPSSFDNSPNVLLEAMACELPVVATRVGGVPRYVTDGQNGLLVEPGQPPALAAALASLLDDPPLRERLRAGGLATVRQGRSWTTSAQKLLALYGRLTPAATPLLAQQPPAALLTHGDA
jgi:glycosyltransferase involved in cell wall biosynthesis